MLSHVRVAFFGCAVLLPHQGAVLSSTSHLRQKLCAVQRPFSPGKLALLFLRQWCKAAPERMYSEREPRSGEKETLSRVRDEGVIICYLPVVARSRGDKGGNL